MWCDVALIRHHSVEAANRLVEGLSPQRPRAAAAAPACRAAPIPIAQLTRRAVLGTDHAGGVFDLLLEHPKAAPDVGQRRATLDHGRRVQGVNPFDLGPVPTRDGVQHPADR